jgi:hypothetical protein
VGSIFGVGGADGPESLPPQAMNNGARSDKSAKGIERTRIGCGVGIADQK